MSLDFPDELIDQLNRGEAEAVEVLFQVFSPYLRAIVRRHLSEKLRSKFDSSDVVQSVWVNVVQQLDREGWHVENRDQLRALLTTIAKRRLISKIRKISGESSSGNLSLDEVIETPAAKQARPSQIVQADDIWSKLLKICPPEHHEVLKLRRQGLLLEEIALRTGMHEGSVRRILRQVARELAVSEEPLVRDEKER